MLVRLARVGCSRCQRREAHTSGRLEDERQNRMYLKVWAQYIDLRQCIHQIRQSKAKLDR